MRENTNGLHTSERNLLFICLYLDILFVNTCHNNYLPLVCTPYFNTMGRQKCRNCGRAVRGHPKPHGKDCQLAHVGDGTGDAEAADLTSNPGHNVPVSTHERVSPSAVSIQSVATGARDNVVTVNSSQLPQLSTAQSWEGVQHPQATVQSSAQVLPIPIIQGWGAGLPQMAYNPNMTSSTQVLPIPTTPMYGWGAGYPSCAQVPPFPVSQGWGAGLPQVLARPGGPPLPDVRYGPVFQTPATIGQPGAPQATSQAHSTPQVGLRPSMENQAYHSSLPTSGYPGLPAGLPNAWSSAPTISGISTDDEAVQDGIPEKTVSKALKGECINLEDFLCTSKHSNEESQIVESNGELLIKPKKTKKNINNFNKWLEAFSRYEELIVKYYGYAAYRHMSRYRIHILHCSLKYNWSNVLVYDVRHRSEKAKFKSFSFADVSSELLNTILDATAVRSNAPRCRRCLAYDHTELEECPFPGRAAVIPARKSKGDKSGEVCNNFNEDRCRFAGCRRRHVCKVCGSRLPYKRCTAECQASGPSSSTSA